MKEIKLAEVRKNQFHGIYLRSLTSAFFVMLFLFTGRIISYKMNFRCLSNMFFIAAYGMEEQDYYRERLEFDAEGNLMMTTHDKKATSDITYRTAGWVIKRYDMPVNAPEQQCAFIKLYEYGDIRYREDPVKPGYVYCYYYGDKEDIYNAIGRVSAEWQHQLYAYGDTVYIDSVLTICEHGKILGGLIDSDGTIWGEVYYTFEEIAGARNWASKDSLRTHFNKRIQYPPQNQQKPFGYSEKLVSSVSRSYKPEGSIRIGAGEKGKEYYDVEQGIPTGKSLFADGDIHTYNYNIVFHKMEVTLKVPICIMTNYHIYWRDFNGKYVSETKNVSRWYYAEKKVSYWILNSMDFFCLSGLEIRNYAFEHEKIYIEQQGLEPEIQKRQYGSYYEHIALPVYDDVIRTDDVFLSDYTVPGVKPFIPDINQQEIADRAVGDIRTRNDYLKIDDSLLLDDKWEEQTVSKPLQTTLNKSCHIYEKGFVIPNTKKNCSDNTVYAVGIYKNIANNSFTNISFLTNHSITIHTPVCAKMTVDKNKKYNQLVNPDSGIPALIINREAVIDVSAYGTHNDIKGYGSRDYSKYVEKTQMKIPFEIIYKGKKICSGTWFDIELGTVRFIIPVGVKEGKYDIKIRNYGLNYATVSNIENHVQSQANKRIDNYAASDTVTVEVVGRIYGLAVSEMNYRVGINDENGMYLGNDRLLPYKTDNFEGNKIDFKLRTTGDMNGKEDYIKIVINFYYIGQDSSRNKIKLYGKKENKDGYQEIETVIRLNRDNRDYAGISEQYRISDSNQANQGLQEWSGVLSIPEEVYIIPDSFDVPQNVSKRELMLQSIKKGYIIANMEIWTVRNGIRRLSYINRGNYEKGYCNMWLIEGYRKQMILEDGINLKIKKGDTILYRIQNDYFGLYRVVGTH